MPPKFSLQNVLEIRHSKVEAIEITLGKLITAQLAAEQLAASLYGLKANLLNKLTATMQGDMDLLGIQILNDNIQQTDLSIKKAEADLAAVKKQVEETRKLLIAAKQGEEVLEILKRKRLEIYNSELNQMEARAQDDIYIARAFQNLG